MSNTTPRNNTYTAGNIQVLEGLEAVRKRPAMYIGDVGVKGLHHLIWEVVDNAIDESLAGHCNEVWVTIHENNAISVRDNGRGIPTDLHPKEKRSALEVVMTVLHAGGKFDKDSYKVSGGLHGVGVSCVNALSQYLKATIHRGGTIHEQSYKKGIPVAPVAKVGESQQRGTTIYFQPDPTIFNTTTYQYDTVASRLRELAFLNAGLRLNLKDLREMEEDGTARSESFYSEGGLKEFVTYLDSNREPLLPEPIYIKNKRDTIAVEIGLIYNREYSENLTSYVNNINTLEGGTHVAGFRRAITRTLKAYAEKSGLLEKAKVNIIGDDFREGLTAVISVHVPEPQFEGQTKTKLGNSEVTGAVDTSVGERLNEYLEEHPNEGRTIIKKVIVAAQARQAARKAREIIQKKDSLTSTSIPGKLAPCITKDPTRAELYIVEGKSAGVTAKQARDRHTQAILAIRGKILNTEKSQEHKIYENEEIRNIITSLGVTFGTQEDSRALEMSNLRYHKIITMTDADVDGSHIRTLLLTFFFRYMPDLIQNGYVYIALPPLYLLKKGSKERYCWSDSERDELLKEFGENVVIQRYKGLGEMNPQQLWDTTMNPEVRKLKQVSIDSAASADHVFSMLMGGDVPPRREFIERHAQYANLDV